MTYVCAHTYIFLSALDARKLAFKLRRNQSNAKIPQSSQALKD